jgi:hypothetical protein
MSTHPGEMPSFDSDLFGPEQFYNSDLLADTVAWPLVNHVWPTGKDWRTASEDQDRLCLPFRELVNGASVRVVIEAECDKVGLNGKLEDIRTARLFVEEPVPVLGKPVALQAARDALAEMREAAEDSEDEEDDDEDLFPFIATWPAAPEEALEVINGINFTFSSHLGTYIRHYRRVWAETAGSLEVDYTESELAGVDLTRYHAHDLEKFELAGRVVHAPQVIYDALRSIKAHPIEML